MAPRLGEILYWMATWIAAIVALLGIAALARGGDRQGWISVASFLVTAGTIWLIGRTLLIFSRDKTSQRSRHSLKPAAKVKCNDLVGSWESDMDDEQTRQRIGRARIEFYSDKMLGYVTFDGDKTQIIKLTYDVHDDFIVTDQPSQPKIQRTRFELLGSKLKLFYGTQGPVCFKKVG